MDGWMDSFIYPRGEIGSLAAGFGVLNVFDRLDLACAAVFCFMSRFDGVDLMVTHKSLIW